jgi:bacteriorhodopsin
MCIFFTIDTFIGYKRKKYTQSYYAYGFLIMSIAFLLRIFRVIVTTVYFVVPQNSTSVIILDILFALMILSGLIIVLKGRAKERNKKTS